MPVTAVDAVVVGVLVGAGAGGRGPGGGGGGGGGRGGGGAGATGIAGNRAVRAERAAIRGVRPASERGRLLLWHRGLDRSDLRRHVQRQERGAHSPRAPRDHRQK